MANESDHQVPAKWLFRDAGMSKGIPNRQIANLDVHGYPLMSGYMEIHGYPWVGQLALAMAIANSGFHHIANRKKEGVPIPRHLLVNLGKLSFR